MSLLYVKIFVCFNGNVIRLNWLFFYLATRIDFTTRLRLVLESYIYSAMPLFKLDGTELTARFPELPSHIVSYIATYKISMRYVYT